MTTNLTEFLVFESSGEKMFGLFHSRLKLCVHRGQRAIRWIKKRKVSLGILSSERTGWQRWRSLLFALVFIYFPQAICVSFGSFQVEGRHRLVLSFRALLEVAQVGKWGAEVDDTLSS